MIKYVCDMCGKPLLEDEDVRYVVKIDIYAAFEGSDSPEDYDDLETVEDFFDAVEDGDDGQGGDDEYVSFRFDLCPECRARFLKDPLSKGQKRRIRFSDN